MMQSDTSKMIADALAGRVYHYRDKYRCENCGKDVPVKQAILVQAPDRKGQISLCQACHLNRTLENLL